MLATVRRQKTRREVEVGVGQASKSRRQVETFSATFVRTVLAGRYPRNAVRVLLFEVRDRAGRMVRDHTWIQDGRAFLRLRLRPGDVVQFEAVRVPYLHKRRVKKRGFLGPDVGFVIVGPVRRSEYPHGVLAN
ncbi:hypothetical protein [Alicyclobacillus macrosporangiidus]|uniref:hypothetical protein n=1 Tax=Alicyclobacillus macrosporangiidus TaxID=392015 RepID=UPI000495F744|nr:hypothetical protein [Alicyclobacillus macrosporangiidus]